MSRPRRTPVPLDLIISPPHVLLRDADLWLVTLCIRVILRRYAFQEARERTGCTVGCVDLGTVLF